MGLFRCLSIRRIVLGFCLWGALSASPLLCQDNTPPPAPEVPSEETPGAITPGTVPSAQPAAAKPGVPVDPFIARQKVNEALLKEEFSYDQNKLVDPFTSFLGPVEAPSPRFSVTDEDFEPPPQPQRPLTPLQKMNLGEIEKGLKAIIWGEFGRKAMVEDSAGKGYIVGVGTPVGEKEGVITDIFNDSVVIQQQVWDSKAKRMLPQNFVVKLKKQSPPK